jgi:sialate O-acetylesterase
MNLKKIRLSATMILVVFGVLLLTSTAAVFADVKLPSVIGDNMVLQRGMKVTIWGWANPGEEVMAGVSWHGMRWAVKADEEGKWMFKMNPPETGGPYEMTISGKNVIRIKNIMVGEVWVCSGQSNMQWSVQASNNAEEEIAAAKYPNIRLFSVKREIAIEPQSDCEGSWSECSPETVPGFTAVGYFFGRKLYKELDMPIGLIHTSWGGTPSEAWTSREMLEKTPDAAPILQRFDDVVANYPQIKKEYAQKLVEWKEAAEKAKAEGKRVPRRPGTPYGPENPHAPAGLYNAMIAPLIPYGINGAIWYQGESNAGRAYQYRKIFPAMIKNWREDWGQGDFSFLFVQLANFMETKPEPVESAWAELREAQSMTLDLPNTGMAVIIDIGEAKDIHPKNKQDVGKRLALWPLAKIYGKDLVYSGPLFKRMNIEDSKIVLSFDNVGGGLVAKGGGALKGFAIAGADRKFVWADAEIDGDKIVVSSNAVSAPVSVRYAWADNPVCNLYNEEELPGSPFRTDSWPGVTINSK